MTHGSSRDQVKGVDPPSLQLVGQPRSELIAYFARRIDPAHEAVSGISQFANGAVGLELAHPRQRKDAVVIRARVCGAVAEVPDIEIGLDCVLRNFPIGGVFAMEARLVAIENSTGTDERDPALADRPGKRRPRRRIRVHHPSIGRVVPVQFAGSRDVLDRHVLQLAKKVTANLAYQTAVRELLTRSPVWRAAPSTEPAASLLRRASGIARRQGNSRRGAGRRATGSWPATRCPTDSAPDRHQ